MNNQHFTPEMLADLLEETRMNPEQPIFIEMEYGIATQYREAAKFKLEELGLAYEVDETAMGETTILTISAEGLEGLENFTRFTVRMFILVCLDKAAELRVTLLDREMEYSEESGNEYYGMERFFFRKKKPQKKVSPLANVPTSDMIEKNILEEFETRYKMKI